MRVALAHDYLMRYGGAERVLRSLADIYPDAPIYALASDKCVLDEYFPNRDIRTSFIDRLPISHRSALPLLPYAAESFDLRDFDVVISSSSAFIKGLITRSKTRHISYCHTPPRFLWEDRGSYTKQHLKYGIRHVAAPALHLLRMWDQHSAKRVDEFIANSQYTAERIKHYYGADSEVIAPPVDVGNYKMSDARRKALGLSDEYFLLVSRLAWWKRAEEAIAAFNMLDLPLVVVGEGPLDAKLRKAAKKNIRFLGGQDDATIRELMAGAKALVHPSLEDFGMTAVEAMAQGTPVIAYGLGGALETVSDGVSGVFYDDSDPLSLADAVRRMREKEWDVNAIKNSVQQFSKENFNDAIREVVLG